MRTILVLVLLAAAPAALAQVNNGVGIGPSSELERPDVSRAPVHRHPAHRTTRSNPPTGDHRAPTTPPPRS